MSVQIEIDQAAMDHLTKQFDILKSGVPRSAYGALSKTAFKIVSEAKNRLKGRGHIVTSRLRNSINYQVAGSVNVKSYTDNTGKSYDPTLKTVTLSEGEIAIGSNVEYAEKIELMDSYLYWAMKNVDVTKTTGDDMKKNMENVMKFGSGIL